MAEVEVPSIHEKSSETDRRAIGAKHAKSGERIRRFPVIPINEPSMLEEAHPSPAVPNALSGCH